MANTRNVFVTTTIILLLVNLTAMLSELAWTTLSSQPTKLLLPLESLVGRSPLLLSSNEMDPDLLLCTTNPYISALNSSLEEISHRMDTWLLQHQIDRQYSAANRPEMTRHNHARFFPLEVLSPCRQKTCVGGPCHGDASKIVCGLEQLLLHAPEKNSNGNDANDNNVTKNNSTCIIYSIGGNNWWQFEKDMLARTMCEIHTFDCTGRRNRFHPPTHPRLHFHHVCVGTQSEKQQEECQDGNSKCGETWTLREIQDKLKHERIDLLKMDIEGFEWPLLESWPKLDGETSEKEDDDKNNMFLPTQILVEIHYQTQFPELHHHLPQSQLSVDQDFKTAADMVDLQVHLLRMGYIIVERDDNPACRHCTELTLLRIRCRKR